MRSVLLHEAALMEAVHLQMPAGSTHAAMVAQLERQCVTETLSASAGNIADAARAAQMNRLAVLWRSSPVPCGPRFPRFALTSYLHSVVSESALNVKNMDPTPLPHPGIKPRKTLNRRKTDSTRARAFACLAFFAVDPAAQSAKRAPPKGRRGWRILLSQLCLFPLAFSPLPLLPPVKKEPRALAAQHRELRAKPSSPFVGLTGGN